MAGTYYDQAKATYITLVDEKHSISSLFKLVNVPSAVWIDESGTIIRIDEDSYATSHTMDDGYEFGRDDYAPMVKDWVAKGAASQYAQGNAVPDLTKTDDDALAEAHFKLGVYFKHEGNTAKANHYWAKAQKLNPDSWNYARQEWSYTPAEADANWMKKWEALTKPYYRPIVGLD